MKHCPATHSGVDEQQACSLAPHDVTQMLLPLHMLPLAMQAGPAMQHACMS